MPQLKHHGKVRGDAACFPESKMLPEWLRGSVGLALQATKELGWGGLGDRSGWTTYKGWDGEGPVHWGVSLEGVALVDVVSWLKLCPVEVPVMVLDESALASGDLAVLVGDFADRAYWSLSNPNISFLNMKKSALIAWLFSVPKPGRLLSGWGKWCEDWQGITRSAHYWYCSQKGGIRKLQDRSVIAGTPEIGLGVGSVWTPPDMGPRAWVPNAQELELFVQGATREVWGVFGGAPGYDHCGDIDWVSSDLLARMNPKWAVPGKHTGFVFAPYEEDGGKRPTAMVASYFDDMETPGRKHDGVFRWGSSPLVHSFDDNSLVTDGILRPQHECPWCAINPWDGLLYTSVFNPPYSQQQNKSFLLKYDINDRILLSIGALRKLQFPLHVARFLGGDSVVELPVYRFAGVCKLEGKLERIQGGCFSQDGCLYLASDRGRDAGSDARPGILRFSMLTGALLDSIGINRDDDPEDLIFGALLPAKWPDWSVQEVEGVCLSPLHCYEHTGLAANQAFVSRYVCSGVWQKEVGYGDDVVYFKYRPL